jgi:hypothetical protein
LRLRFRQVSLENAKSPEIFDFRAYSCRALLLVFYFSQAGVGNIAPSVTIATFPLGHKL